MAFRYTLHSFFVAYIVYIHTIAAHIIGIQDIRTALQRDPVTFLFLHQAVFRFLLPYHQLLNHIKQLINLCNIAHLVAGKPFPAAVSDTLHQSSDRLCKMGNHYIDTDHAEHKTHQYRNQKIPYNLVPNSEQLPLSLYACHHPDLV